MATHGPVAALASKPRQAVIRAGGAALARGLLGERRRGRARHWPLWCAHTEQVSAPAGRPAGQLRPGTAAQTASGPSGQGLRPAGPSPFHSRQARGRAVTWATEVGGAHGPVGFDACAGAAQGLRELHSPVTASGGAGGWGWPDEPLTAWSGEGAQSPPPVFCPPAGAPRAPSTASWGPRSTGATEEAAGPRRRAGLAPCALPEARGRAQSPNALVTGVAPRATGPQP